MAGTPAGGRGDQEPVGIDGTRLKGDMMVSSLPEKGSSPRHATEFTFAHFVSVVVRWRRFVFWCVVLCTVLSTIVAFLLPPKFKGTASVFPAEKTELLGALEGVSSIAKALSPAKGLAALGANPELDRYMAILKSGRVLGAVIQKFDLVKVYDFTSYPMEKATKELLNNVDFTAETEGNLVITVFDEDRRRAADMANFFVEELNRTNTELQVQNARGNRKFIGERYEKNLADLAAAEDSLRAFQKRFGVVSMPDQAEASIKASAELSAQLALKQVQLGVQRRTLAADHPQVAATETEVQELQKKITEMNSIGPDIPGQMKILVPFKEIPDLAVQYMRRYREVEIQYKILQFLTPIYEQAKVEEQRSTPSVVVLDRASPAERKSKPKRLLIMLGGFLVGLVGSLAWVAVSERWNREKESNTPAYHSLSESFADLRSDFHSIRTRLRKKKQP